MKAMSNLLYHKDEDEGDGSSSGKGNVNAVRGVSARGAAVVMVVIDRRKVCRIGSS